MTREFEFLVLVRSNRFWSMDPRGNCDLVTPTSYVDSGQSVFQEIFKIWEDFYFQWWSRSEFSGRYCPFSIQYVAAYSLDDEILASAELRLRWLFYWWWDTHLESSSNIISTNQLIQNKPIWTKIARLYRMKIKNAFSIIFNWENLLEDMLVLSLLERSHSSAITW